jgi:hypothetical protein
VNKKKKKSNFFIFFFIFIRGLIIYILSIALVENLGCKVKGVY